MTMRKEESCEYALQDKRRKLRDAISSYKQHLRGHPVVGNSPSCSYSQPDANYTASTTEVVITNPETPTEFIECKQRRFQEILAKYNKNRRSTKVAPEAPVAYSIISQFQDNVADYKRRRRGCTQMRENVHPEKVVVVDVEKEIVETCIDIECSEITVDGQSEKVEETRKSLRDRIAAYQRKLRSKDDVDVGREGLDMNATKHITKSSIRDRIAAYHLNLLASKKSCERIESMDGHLVRL